MQTDEQVIQLREDEQDADGEVFLGDVPTDEIRGVVGSEVETDIEVDVATLPVAGEAFAEAIRALDADRAGDAAKPQYQPSIPGILPPFDWRSAQLTTESLEENCASTERAWETAKKEAADAKKEYDESVDALREHIQVTHRARIDAEYQHGKGDVPIAPVPDLDAPAKFAACWTEQKTGRPCSICRNLLSAPTNGETAQHVAAAAAVDANAGTLDAAGLAASIAAVTGIIVAADSLAAWTPDDFKAVARFLEEVAAIASLEDGDLASVSRPNIMGRPHEATETGECRVCGAALDAVATAVERLLVVGELVGLDCPGESAEPAPKATPRHRKPADRQKARQARGKKDHAAEQVEEGKKKSAAKSRKEKASS